MDKLFWRSALLLLRFYPIPSPRQKLRAPCATVYAEGAGNRTAQRDIAKDPRRKAGIFHAGVFSDDTAHGREKRVNGALRARAAVRPALRQGSAFLLGLAGGWAVLYGALMPFGLGLTLGFAEDCFAVGAAGAALGVLARSFGTLTVESVCLLCALGAAVAARWLWPGRFVPAVAAGCGTLVGSAVCFAAGEENGVQTILFCGGDALLAAAAGYGLRRFPPENRAWAA